MALNVKPLFPLSHPEVSFPDLGGALETASSELDLDKENRQKQHLLESEEDELYHKVSKSKRDPKLKEKLNIL